MKHWQLWFSCVWEEKHVVVRDGECPEAAEDRGWKQGLCAVDEACLNDGGAGKKVYAEKAGRGSDLWEEVETLGHVLIDLTDTNYVSCARQKWCICVYTDRL